ncbi:MAG: sialidase family protein [Anaerolineae bacterium]|nr:sialidase family protein [Anaerolineae bacterium]
MSRMPSIGRWLWILAVLGISVVVTGPLEAQEPYWSQPIELTLPHIGWDWFPDIAVDSGGNVHLVWSGGWCSPAYKKPCLMYQRQHGGVWQSPYDVFLDMGAGQSAIRNALAADPVGRLHLVYLKDFQYIVYQQAWASHANSAWAWSEPRRMSGFGHAYFPDINVGPDGTLHAVWTESAGNTASPDCPLGDCSDIFYRQSTDGGVRWSPPINLSRSEVGTMKVHILADTLGRVHVFWEEGGDRWVSDRPVGVAYTLSTDGGQTWSTPQVFTHTQGFPRQIMLGVDGRGQIVAIWRLVPGDSIYYQVSSDGRQWSAPQRVPGIWPVESTAVFDDYDVAADSRGHLHFVVSGRNSPTGRQAIFRLEWDGTSWLEPEQVSPYEGYPEFPRIAVGLGNTLHVAWYSKQWSGYEEGQEMRLWYSARKIPAPAWTPAPLPTPTETPPPPTRTPFPTPTPFPTIAPDAVRPFNPATLYTEGDEVVGLLLSLLPVAALIGLVMALSRSRRR